MTGIFITATGTDIGKTTFLAQLLRYDRQANYHLTASKPLISGWPQNDIDIQRTDTAILLAAQNLPLTPENIHMLSPWRFIAPKAPSIAAKMEGKTIDCKALVADCRQRILMSAQRNQHHFIEGVGGVMAPIWGKWTCLDWMEQLASPCILVVGAYLGTFSHALTAIKVLQMKKIPVLAVVVTTSEPTVEMLEICRQFDELLSPIPIYPLPYRSDIASVATLYQDISLLLSNYEDKAVHIV